MTTCPKCNHVRNADDDSETPGYQCPNCGVIYAKYGKTVDVEAIKKARRKVVEEKFKNQNYIKDNAKPVIDKSVYILKEGAKILKDNVGEYKKTVVKKNKDKAAFEEVQESNRKPLTVEQQILVNMELDKFKTNHILHLLLSIFTLSVWVIIWLLCAASNVSQRNLIRKKYGMKKESNGVIYLAWMAIAFVIFTISTIAKVFN